MTSVLGLDCTAARTRDWISASDAAVPFRNMVPCCVTVIRSSACSWVAPVAAWGRLTSMPTGSVRNVVKTIKKTTRMNMTSIIGTISTRGVFRRSLTIATSLTPNGGDQFNDLPAAAVHVRDPPIDDAADPVVHRHGRDRNDETRRRRDQRFGDADAQRL